MSSTSCVESPVTVSSDASGARIARSVMLRLVVEAAVDLELGDRAEADADAERRQPQQIALAGPETGYSLVVRVVEAAFDQDAAGANRFRDLR